LNVTATQIGQTGNSASSSTQGLGGNGIEVVTDGNSLMTMLVGNQNLTWANQSIVAGPDGTSSGQQPIPGPAPAPDVTLYGNKGAGILVKNAGNSNFFGQTYDTSAQYNGNRGYSALIAQNALSINQINYSSFSNNTQEGIAIVANAESQSNLWVLVPDPSQTKWGFYNMYDYMNFNVATQGALVLTNSNISNNGVTSPYYPASSFPPTGLPPLVNGVEIDVSTYAKVTADIRDNVMKGNSLSDFSTSSFIASTGSGGEFGGFNANGTINGANKVSTTSLENVDPAQDDRIYLEDTAQLDLRFVGNIGNKMSPDSQSSDNSAFNGATGAHGFDTSTAKSNNGYVTSLFQVNAYNYDVISSVTNNADGTQTILGTNLLPLDGFPTGTVQDPANYPGPNGGIRLLQAGIVNIDGYYTNPNANPNNVFQTAYTQVRMDDITQGVNGTATQTAPGTLDTSSTGIISYTGATGTFVLANGGLNGATSGDTIRIHLLDTNSFANSSATQVNVQSQFQNGFTQGFIGSLNVVDPVHAPGTVYTTNPLAPEFNFPSSSFAPY
jgi:hypothetical protein